MEYQHILYEVNDGIATITINRPEVLNALNRRANYELTDAWFRFRDDDSTIVAVITGAGERAFCAGADIKPQKTVAEIDPHSPYGRYGELGVFPREANLGKPMIAAINGLALGMGAVIALQCEIRVATANASLGYPLIKIGRFPPRMHEMWMLGPGGLALEALLTGDPMSAQDAHRVGLVNHLVERDQLLPKSYEIAGKIRDNAPLVVRAIKETWDSEPLYQLVKSTRIYTHYGNEVSQSEDFKEGPRAFAEKRKPVWQGR
jgi:enoyl-CoA hydratase/carnithine racemase